MASWRRASSNIAAQVVSLAAGVIDRIVLFGLLLRAWGAETYADYAILQSWAALLLMVELGAQIYFQNEEQSAYVKGDKARFRRIASTHLGLSLAVVVPLALGFTALVIAGGATRALRLPNIDLETARWVVWLFGIGNLLSVLRAPASTVFSASGEFAYVTLVSAGVSVVNTLSAFAAVSLGAGPLTVAGLFFALYGVGGLAFFHFDVRARRREWTGPPALPSRAEFAATFGHVKWFALQWIAPTIWLQTPVLVFAWNGAAGAEIAAFLLMRTMVNQIRQTFQFAAVGAGLEIATFSHAGDYKRAWEVTAQVGRLTTVICAGFVGGILAFGRTVAYYWTGDGNLYDLGIAVAMLLPLLAIAPLQQPMALLQYTNRSREVGLLRLGLILFGPLGCIVGERLGGPPGLAAGLGIAEALSYALLAPRLAAMPALAGFAPYFLRTLALGVGATAICLGAALALQAFVKPATLPLFLAEVAVWGCLVVLPLVYSALPAGVRRAARAAHAGGPGGLALDVLYALSKIGWLFAEPSRVLLIAALAGLALGRRGRRLTVAALALVALLAVLPLGGLALSRLEATFPPLRDPGKLDGIIVIGGALNARDFDAYPASGFGPAVSRLYEAARLAKAYPQARLFDVGGPEPAPPGRAEADEAADVLVALGVPRERIEIERASRNTYENAVNAAALAHPHPGQRWALITSAFHMPRAVGCFRAAGFEVVADPVDYHWSGALRPGFDVTGGLADFDLAAHEYFGLFSYRWLGRTTAVWPGP